MYTRITEPRDKKFPTRIPLKALPNQTLGLAVYVQIVSDNTLIIKLEGYTLPEDRTPRALTFEGVSYEDVEPGVCCLFTSEFFMPKHDITLRLTSYYWRMKPLVQGQVKRYGEWIQDDTRDYEIAVILPPPPPPEFKDIVISFSGTPPNPLITEDLRRLSERRID